MTETAAARIKELYDNQKRFFATRRTRDLAFRIEQLRRLKSAIEKNENQLMEALWTDLHKSAEEAYLTEISMVTQEIDNHIRHVRKWARPERVPTPFHLWPSFGKIIYEPLGVALIMAPWNYPFQLLINPLVGAISSGNCAILKPSPYTPAVAMALERMISGTFDPAYISIIQGGRNVNDIVLDLHLDLIFFTGSPVVGKVVMQAAARHLTPVILELGGKSPCIVDADADIDIAARRIAWGKAINAGQTCIAPDYLFVHRSVKNELLDKIAESFILMYGKDIQAGRFYPRIVNDRAMKRLQGLLAKGTIHSGGRVDENERFISPTILEGIGPDDPVMQEEIFGPILPVMAFDRIGQVLDFVNAREKPLAFYYFGNRKKAWDVICQTSSGGGCINDTLMHVANHHLPFGGVGNSGMGKYHGRESFLAFSNRRAIAVTTDRMDPPLRYPPFKYFKWIRKLMEAEWKPIRRKPTE